MNPADLTHLFAIPDARSAIDFVHPDTGRSLINGETLEQIRQRYPAAQLYTWDAWHAQQTARQAAVPLTWSPTTAEQYHEMLEVLPPAAWIDGGFLVGEPDDHDLATGRPRFQAYRQQGETYSVASRPMTIAEFRALMKTT
jgi:hypothetical protein